MSTPLDPPVPTPTRFYDAVGRVIIEGAALEHRLSALLLALVDSDAAAYLVRGQSTEQLIQQTRAVLGGTENATKWQILPLLDEAKRLSDLRNHVVHSDWGEFSVHDMFDWVQSVDLTAEPRPELPLVAARARRLQAAYQVRTFTVAELIQLARDLERLSRLLLVVEMNLHHERAGREIIDITPLLDAPTDSAHAWRPDDEDDDEGWLDTT